MSLCLTTSSFSLNDYLTVRLTAGTYNQDQLQLALSLSNLSAKYIVFKKSTQYSLQWLNLAKTLARKDQDIAWQLVLYYQQKKRVRERLYWTNHAFQLGSESAIIDRAKQLATTTENYQQAKALLQAIDNEESRMLQVTLAVKFADITLLQTLIPKLTSLNEQTLLKELLTYQVLPRLTNGSLTSGEAAPTVNCSNRLQFFATNLTDLNRLTGLFSKMQNKDFFNQQFCFETPKYIAQENLQCSHQSNERVNCDVEKLVEQELSDDIKYIGVMAPQGIANVDNGVVYIDHLDSHLVLEHELLHLVGFIDEYPLNELNTACQHQGAIAKNIVNLKQTIYSSELDARAKVMHQLPWKGLIKSTTPISHKTPTGYRLGTPKGYSNEVGLFVANTCKNYLTDGFENETFKPINTVTQLQYFEEQLPLAYEKLVKQMSDQFDMPSYHSNIGKKYKQQGDFEQANYWFEKSAGVQSSVKINTFGLTKAR
ncbi:hypothetical protein RGQ13_12190 [Thalassotalea psychrophila]|uniref:Sel1 repeat family protein n=1 Tax=Thalassotalea psychrophila TaxID=3065647 RepID=A0ABY9TQ09_9GAMM|nr:hypothetical protein RGQ13_12190 [Colwelliaceae bacterium SQ149]